MVRLHQLVQPVLNHGFGLGVERICGLVEDKDAGLGKQCPRDGKANPLMPRQRRLLLASGDGIFFRLERLFHSWMRRRTILER
jgi:hypothetical protein